MSEMPEVAEALTVRPGQTLIVRVDRKTRSVQARLIKAALNSKLPGVEVIVICCDQIIAYDPVHQDCGGTLMPSESGMVCDRCGLMEP